MSTPNRPRPTVPTRGSAGLTLISHSKHHNQTQKPREKILITNSGQVFFIISVVDKYNLEVVELVTLDSILILSVTVLQIKLLHTT